MEVRWETNANLTKPLAEVQELQERLASEEAKPHYEVSSTFAHVCSGENREGHLCVETRDNDKRWAVGVPHLGKHAKEEPRHSRHSVHRNKKYILVKHSGHEEGHEGRLQQRG